MALETRKCSPLASVDETLVLPATKKSLEIIYYGATIIQAMR